MEPSNLQLNLQSIREIVQENPATSHIYMRRPDGVLVDIPLAQADFTIRNHPDWVVEGGSVPNIELAVTKKDPGASDELPILPAKPSEEEVPAAKPKKPTSRKVKK